MSTNLSRRTVLTWAMVFVGGSLSGCDCAPEQTVYLVRHAEKAASGGEDPALSELGQRRAEGLVAALDGVELSAVYATQFQRTSLTVEPAAAVREMKVETLDAGDVDALVAAIRKHEGAVLVSGHSNTVPEIAKKLGVTETIELGESDYGDLFVVRVSSGKAKLERRRFDPK